MKGCRLLALAVVAVIVIAYLYCRKTSGAPKSLVAGAPYYLSDACNNNSTAPLLPRTISPRDVGAVYSLPAGGSLVSQSSLAAGSHFFIEAQGAVLSPGNPAQWLIGESFVGRIYTTDPTSGAQVFLTALPSAGSVLTGVPARAASDPSQLFLITKIGIMTWSLTNMLSPINAPGGPQCVNWMFIPT